jgi:predicted O-linked N-acetylglucosamine transferase (SPINDLY family)
VTKQGNQFAARVAASLLNAVGLPELVTQNETDYEALILELATNREKLTAIREKLAINRLTQPLFDTKRYTRDFEAGLTAAFDLYYTDQDPQDIWV